MKKIKSVFAKVAIVFLFFANYINCVSAQIISKGCFAISSEYYNNYFSIVQTYDDNYVIGGWESGLSGNYLNQNFWVFKIDQNANIIWSSSLGGPYQDGCYRVIETSDNNILAVGFTGNSANQDILVVKYSPEGEILWSKNIDHPVDIFGDNAYAQAVVETEDGYVITGVIAIASSPGTEDGYIIKLDFDGNKIWSTRLSDPAGYGYEYPQNITLAQEGGYTISGWGDAGFITHVDNNGNVQWTVAAADAVSFDLIQTVDSDYLLSGYRFSTGQPNGNAFVTKLDTAGNQIWSKTYGGDGIETFYGLYLTNDGGFIGAGTADSGTAIDVATQKGFVVKCDSDGNVQWSKKINTTAKIQDVIQTTDGGYVLLGNNGIFKLDANGNACSECELEDFGNGMDAGEIEPFTLSNVAITDDNVIDSVYIEYTGGTKNVLCQEVVESIQNNTTFVEAIRTYPNPADKFINFEIPAELLSAKIQLLNAQGRILKTISAGNDSFTQMNTENYPDGIYFLQISNEEKNYYSKFIITH